jgi:hypothetical protein
VLAFAMLAGVLPAVAAAETAAAPATDLTGKWSSEFDSQVGVQKYVFDLKQDGAKLSGTASFERMGEKGQVELKEGKVEGGQVTFVEMLDFQGTSIRIEYKGQLSGDEMKLTRQVGDFATEQIVAKRVKP